MELLYYIVSHYLPWTKSTLQPLLKWFKTLPKTLYWLHISWKLSGQHLRFSLQHCSNLHIIILISHLDPHELKPQGKRHTHVSTTCTISNHQQKHWPFYVYFSFHNQATGTMASIPSPPNSIFLFNVKSLFAVLHCKATIIYTAFVAATIDFLFLNSLNKSQTGQLVWMSPLSLLLSASPRLSYLCFIFLSFLAKLSPLSFPLFLTHWCNVLLYFCHWYCLVCFQGPEVKKKKKKFNPVWTEEAALTAAA